MRPVAIVIEEHNFIPSIQPSKYNTTHNGRSQSGLTFGYRLDFMFRPLSSCRSFSSAVQATTLKGLSDLLGQPATWLLWGGKRTKTVLVPPRILFLSLSLLSLRYY